MLVGTTYRGYFAGTPGEFLRTCLPAARSYRRASGYFTSGVFAVALSEFVAFFQRGGSVELVTGDELSNRDIAAIESGLLNARAVRQQSISTVLKGSPRDQVSRLLSWVIARSQLHIKIATPQPGHTGIYHEKFGIFDVRGGQIAFEGSVNETEGGWRHNFERLRVHVDGTSLRRLEGDFDRLWRNQTAGLRVLDVAQAFAENLVRTRERPGETSPAQPRATMQSQKETLRLPSRITLRSYQEEAIRAWIAAQGCGILEMATGSGKTIAALAAATRVHEGVGGQLAIIIVCPYVHLVDQWIRECREFGLNPLRCAGASSNWSSFAQAGIYRVNTGARRLLSLVTTNATFSGPAFQAAIDRLGVRTMLIADEVHNLGAPRLSAYLPERVALRMGLSATPTRWRDPSGTDQLAQYFGDVVFRFGLKEALSGPTPVLTPYRYFPILVELDEDEQEQYLELTAALARFMSGADVDDLSEPALALLIRRSRLVACARGKLDALKGAITPYRKLPHSIVYCGDGRVELSDDDDDSMAVALRRQIDVVTRMLRVDLDMEVAQFTAETSGPDREAIRERFAAGDLDAIVAIRCLDEGVDIPEIERAFILASSTNPRQFIQRRGRILRRAPGKETAEVFDFIVVPPDAARFGEGTRVGRRLIEKEMQRVVEFAELAANGPEARRKLSPLLTNWDLQHL